LYHSDLTLIQNRERVEQWTTKLSSRLKIAPLIVTRARSHGRVLKLLTYLLISYAEALWIVFPASSISGEIVRLIEKVDERRKNDSSRAFFELRHVL